MWEWCFAINKFCLTITYLNYRLLVVCIVKFVFISAANTTLILKDLLATTNLPCHSFCKKNLKVEWVTFLNNCGLDYLLNASEGKHLNVDAVENEMGNCQTLLRKPQLKVAILVVGLDNAGKTTVSKVLQRQPINAIAPTVGYSSDEFKFRNFFVTMIDVGGGSKIRAIWKNYFAEVYGVIYVVDSSDHNRMSESKAELAQLLSNDLMSGKPVLLLANKQDQQGALDELELSQQLNLEAVVNEHKCLCKVEMTTAIIGKKDAALKNGLTWLLSVIKQNFVKLNHRVEKDIKERDLQIEEELVAKRERIRQRKELAAMEAEAGNDSKESISSEKLMESAQSSLALTNDKAKVAELPSASPEKLVQSNLETEAEVEQLSSASPERIVHSGLGDELMDDFDSEEEINLPGSVPELRGAPTYLKSSIPTTKTLSTGTKNANEYKSQVQHSSLSTSNSLQCSSNFMTPKASDALSWSFVNTEMENGDSDLIATKIESNGKKHNKITPYNPALDDLLLPRATHPPKKLTPLNNPPKTPDTDLKKGLPSLIFAKPNFDADNDVII